MIPFNSMGNIFNFFVFFTYIFTTRVTCLRNITDLESLLAIRKAILNDPQEALISWNETLHFCSWQGILCSKRHQNRVISINIMSQGLYGSMSPHIGNLSFLRNINFQNNSFFGPIPNEIGHLRRLQAVALGNNSFSGEIPRNLSQCTNMYHLLLDNNNLSGTIIPELSNLLNLETLSLSTNQFSGTVPPFIGNLTSLEILSLAECRFEGEIPDSFSQLRSLQSLRLNNNNLTGIIPYGIYNISSISTLSLFSNQLHGTIASEIGSSFPRLRQLNLYNNYFTGEIPLSLSNSSLLEQITLASNNFTGKIMVDFTRLVALRWFVAWGNSLEGNLDFVAGMSNCSELGTIEISRNLLSGSLPNSIANLSNQLTFLHLASNQLQGSIPSGIENLIGLTTLGIEGNDLEGPIPSEIGKLNQLRYVYLGGNMLTNQIPFSFGNLSLLMGLTLEENSFFGTIPQSLGNCANMLRLSLRNNNLSGSIPPEIANLSSISISFDLAHNAFTGTIPFEIGSLKNLVILDLSHNRLSGPIPDSLSQCIMLQEIHLNSNSFYGQIPDSLRSLKSMAYFDISQNNFSGQVRSFLGELNLALLNISFNRLQGEVPTQGVFQNESAMSLEGNSELCGGMEILKLPPCSSKNSKKHFSALRQVWTPIVVVVICVVLIACFIYVFVYRKQRHGKNESPMAMVEVLRLSYRDLLKATSGFSTENLLGVGGFGSVYKGILEEGECIVAVKVFDLSIKAGSKSFVSECIALKDIRHRNLVKILSVCFSTDFGGNDFKALIYEFMSNGNLDDWLHQTLHTGESGNLTLGQRLSIIVDVACALEYLHCGTESIIVHGDLKPSNILLDENMTAHIGDFGLAKVLNKISGHPENSSIGIKGTLGYIPPEYGTSNKVSTEGDVYSFGILLMEVFTGRRPTDDTFENYSTLCDFVKSTLPSEGVKILDPVILLEQKYKTDVRFKDGVTSLLGIALACTMEVPKDRMLIGDIVKDLQKIINTFN